MSWQKRLHSLPVTDEGIREAQEPVATEIVLEFMKEEVYPRLKVAQETLVQNGFDATISPKSVEEISSDTIPILLSVQNKSDGINCKNSLQFKRKTGFEIDIILDRQHPVLSLFTLDRESPELFVELYLEDFSERFAIVQAL